VNIAGAASTPVVLALNFGNEPGLAIAGVGGLYNLLPIFPPVILVNGLLGGAATDARGEYTAPVSFAGIVPTGYSFALQGALFGAAIAFTNPQGLAIVP
jgi:hypothetical protein